MKRLKLVAVVCGLVILGFTAFAGAAEGMKRILVFGDSNTFGYVEDAQGIVNRLPLNTAWPGRMAALLGADYDVVVEGLSRRGHERSRVPPGRAFLAYAPGHGHHHAGDERPPQGQRPQCPGYSIRHHAARFHYSERRMAAAHAFSHTKGAGHLPSETESSAKPL